MKDYRGFTLVELMVTLAIAAILLSIAAPNFVSFIKNNRITTITNDLLADLALARSEAAKRGQAVSVCISSDGLTCTGSNWLGGRLVFADSGTAGTKDGSDSIIRVSEAKSNGTTMTSSGFSNTGYIRYGATGTVTTGNTNIGTFKVCDDRTGSFGRLLSISNTGRPYVQTAQTCP
mgnify:CR=1 FL=1